MRKKKNLPNIEVDGSKVYFGRWYIEAKVDRKYNLRAGKELGISLSLSGGTCHHNGIKGLDEHSVQLSGPGSSITHEDAEELECRAIERLAPLCKKFLKELEEALKEG